jgi:hypothetical protein
MPTQRKRGTAPARKASPTTAKPGKARPGVKGARPPMAPRRDDYGAPVEGFFARQPPSLRAILEALRALVEEAAPGAAASLKWGMPIYTLAGEMLCALAGFKSHVNLILPGAPGTYADPRGLLEGEGKTGRHLKVRALEELPREAVRGWLRTAAARARREGAGG